MSEVQLPEGWVWESLKGVAKVITGGTPSKGQPEFYGSDFPFFKPTDLQQGFYTKQSSDGLTELGLREARVIPANSILVTCIGATIGKTGFSRVVGACNQQINAIIPGSQLLPEFGYYTNSKSTGRIFVYGLRCQNHPDPRRVATA